MIETFLNKLWNSTITPLQAILLLGCPYRAVRSYCAYTLNRQSDLELQLYAFHIAEALRKEEGLTTFTEFVLRRAIQSPGTFGYSLFCFINGDSNSFERSLQHSRFLEAFINEDTFLLFLIIMLLIILVLIVALFKTRKEYLDLVNSEEKLVLEKPKDDYNLDSLRATSADDVIKENEPVIRTVNIPTIETYDDIIEKYKASEEENAVISADELELRTRQRMNDLGINENQVTIAKYEEEQEKKAIISYEQLLKNASNITLSYKEESKKNRKDKDAPRVNKIEIEQKEVVGAEIYLEEEEFLKILKDFRASLNENIFN